MALAQTPACASLGMLRKVGEPRASAGSGLTREEIIGQMAKGIQDRAPKVFDLEAVGNAYPTSYEESMNTVLFQE